MITDKVGGSSAKPEVSKQSKEKRLKHKVSGYKSQSKQRSIAGYRLLLRTLCIAIVWSIGPGRRSLPRPWEQGGKPANFFKFIGMTFFILRVARFFVGSDNIRRCPKTFRRRSEELRQTRTWEYKATLTSLLKKDKSIIHIDFSFLSLVLVSLNN